LAQALISKRATTKRGKPFDKNDIYRVLNNRVYLGEAVHEGTAYPGEHDAIITREQWDAVHATLQTSARARTNRTRRETPALLRGLLFGTDGRAMSPTHARGETWAAISILCQPIGVEGRRRSRTRHPRGQTYRIVFTHCRHNAANQNQPLWERRTVRQP